MAVDERLDPTGARTASSRRGPGKPLLRGPNARCRTCGQVRLLLHLADHDKVALTTLSCRCGCEWFDDGRPVGLAEILQVVPKSRRRRPTTIQ